MKALAEIIAISNEFRSTSNDGSQMSRFVITFQIGAELLHATVFKRTENLDKYPLSTDGYVKGAIGTLDYDIRSEIRYSSKDNSPYVQYTVKHKWLPKIVENNAAPAAVSATSQATAPEPSQHEVAAGMAEAAAVAEAHLDENGLPF